MHDAGSWIVSVDDRPNIAVYYPLVACNFIIKPLKYAIRSGPSVPWRYVEGPAGIISLPPPLRSMIPALLILFGASGAAALIYEVVWLQLLQLVIGSSAVSLAVLLGTFMGGMCLGSIFFGRTVAVDRSPLRVYAILELGTAACGILVLFGLPLIGHLYTAAVTHGLPGMLLRGIACALCLLPPTLLMGATLPAISRWVATS